MACALGLPLAACGAARAAQRPPDPPTAAAEPEAAQAAALRAGVVAYFEERGYRSTEYLLKTAFSRADPSWAMFSVPETDDASVSIRGDEGLAHEAAPGVWGVVAFGSPGTICPRGLPADVASQLALSCG